MRPTPTVNVHLKYFAMLREIIGKKEEVLGLLEGSTIQDVITKLAEAYGERFTTYVLNSESQLRENLALLRNGEAVQPTMLGATRVRDGDVIVILPPVGGG